MTTGNAGDFSFSLSIDQRAATRDFEAFKAKTTGGLKSIDGATKPVAKALGAVSGALGSVGGSAATVTRGLGDIAGLLATGGGLTFAITGATLLVAKLSEAFIEARESAKTFGLSVDASITARAASRAASLEELHKGVSSFEESVRTFGKSREEVLGEDLMSRALKGEEARLKMQQRVLDVEEAAAEAAHRAGNLRGEGVAEEAELLGALARSLRARYDDIQKDSAQAFAQLEKLQGLNEEMEGLRAAAGGGAPSTKAAAGPRIDPAAADDALAKAFEDEMRAVMEYDERFRQQEAASEQSREAELWRATQERIDLAKMEAEEKGRIADEFNAAQRDEQKKITDSHKAQHQATLNAMTEATVAASSAAANAGLVFVDALFGGESLENALLHATSMIARQAGSFTIGKGIEAMASGVALLANPLTAALSPGAFALGGTLLAAGVALGGVVPGAIGMLTGSGGGGDVATAPRSDMGVNAPRASQGGDDKGSGQTVINISYGVTGPRGDETAALVAQSLQTARRRGHA